MAINLDRLVGFHHQAVKVRTEQMEVISGNLANANTPGYKARGIDFQQAMKSAKLAQSHNLVKTHEKHMSGSTQPQWDLKFREPTQPDTGDGNTVDIQHERNQFLDVGMRFQASTELLSGKIKGMKKALSGGQGG
ncbi:flagellar basal body rod protein FlgB [Alteromonas oceanisediminis]|uniref:flagellar basal body rod protein FlgB n=1 Tax=Alteromonas oceanisediminis TaxID=2836180 RepID=UPI001BD9772B|nr:flagellar basal body rod protein FlgB [Alteromonas oceanisediminis]MBT0584968.1 flagellar basal body rod protein FlgB [Alteromonas oceanisediminis]